VAYEDLRVSNMVKNHCLAKSLSDASWYLFRQWIEYFAVKFDKITIAVAPHYTSQKCSSCGVIVKKSLSTKPLVKTFYRTPLPCPQMSIDEILNINLTQFTSDMIKRLIHKSSISNTSSRYLFLDDTLHYLNTLNS